MMYLARSLSRTLTKAAAAFPVVLITGPRQVGKTTLFRESEVPAKSYVSLDDVDERSVAQRDPKLFLATHAEPLVIDEVQYAPQLFSAIKLLVDRGRRPGMYWLTGSQKFHLMHGVTESLAGRVAVLNLLGFSQSEVRGYGDSAIPFLPTREWLAQASSNGARVQSPDELYRLIWKGAFPQAALGADDTHELFYSSYLQTYIERDVRALTRVHDENSFLTFTRAAAARTGQLLNYTDLARDADVDLKTAKAWLTILETSGLVFLLRPYHNNVTKRLIKTPKLYFLDTGLCAYLTRWLSPQTLASGSMAGAILETFIFTEILKSYWHNGRAANFYFYRDRDQREIDLLIEQDGVLHPIECKKSANPSAFSFPAFASLEALGVPLGPGAIICLRETPIALDECVTAIPVSWL